MNGPTERERELEAEVQRLRVMLDDLPEDDEHAWQTNASQWLWERNEARARVAVLEQQIAAIGAESEKLAYRKALLAIEACDQMPEKPRSEYLQGRADAYARATRAVESLYDGVLAAGVDPKGSMVVDNPTEPAEEWDGVLPRPKRRVVARYVMKRTDDPTEETP